MRKRGEDKKPTTLVRAWRSEISRKVKMERMISSGSELRRSVWKWQPQFPLPSEAMWLAHSPRFLCPASRWYPTTEASQSLFGLWVVDFRLGVEPTMIMDPAALTEARDSSLFIVNKNLLALAFCLWFCSLLYTRGSFEALLPSVAGFITA